MNRFEAIERAIGRACTNFTRNIRNRATLLYVDYLFIYVPIWFYSIFYRTALRSLARYFFHIYFISYFYH